MKQPREIYFSEAIRFFLKKRRALILATLGSFVLTFLLFVVYAKPHFLAEASFRQAENQIEEASTLQSLLKSMKVTSESSSAVSIMLSRQFLTKVAAEVGWQIEPVHTKRLRALFSKKDQTDFSFHSVSYQGDAEKIFYVRGGDYLEILNEKKEKIAIGKRGDYFGIPDAEFVIDTFGKGEVKFRLLPMRAAVGQLKKNLKVKTDRFDTAILNLHCKHLQRKKAMTTLDAVMAQFQSYLKKEHDEVARAQIAYLEKRQNELGKQFDVALGSHVKYLQKTLGNDGFLGLAQEVEMLSAPKEKYMARQNQLDLDAKRWRENQLIASADHPWIEGEGRLEELSWQKSHIHLIEMDLSEFEGIDLETAQTLYTEYSKEFDQLSSQIEQMESFAEKMDDFSLNSLTQVLNDPVSQGLIEKATELSLKVEDTANWSEKERSHLREALDKQKIFLKEHLEKNCEALIVKKDLVSRKMGALKQLALKLIDEEQERIETKLDELKKKMGDLPEKWRLESRLKMKKEIILQILEGLSQFSESKVIMHHLFHVESKPLDSADAPPVMQNPRLFLFSSMGGLMGGFFTFVALLIIQGLRGFPISKEYLRDVGYHFLGYQTEGEDELLKKLLLHIQPGEIIGLIRGNYGNELKNLLERKGYEVGRTTIEGLEKDTGFGYNFLLLESSKQIDSAEALEIGVKCDRCLLYLTDEKEESLLPYLTEKTLCVLEK